jgi:lactate permease
MYWIQNYDPLHWRFGSTALAALPVLTLLGLLASGRVPAWLAATGGFLAAFTVAVLGFGMPFVPAVMSGVCGIVFAIFQIIWLIVAAVFLYQIVVDTGRFDVMKASIAGLSADRRVQVVLVAFCFGAFIEGAAGFGAPVAISAAFLVGLGFQPFQAALLCLIANTAPVAWGSIGTPIRTLAKLTKIDVELLSATTGRILPPLSLIIPAWLVITLAGVEGASAVWPILVVVGGTFALTQFAWSNYVGFELVDIAASVASLVAGIVLLKFWRPREVWRFPGEDAVLEAAIDKDVHAQCGLQSPPLREVGSVHLERGGSARLTPGAIARAWSPFGVLTLTVLIWGTPAIKELGIKGVKPWLDERTSWKPAAPSLHLKVVKGVEAGGPANPTPETAETATIDITPISSTGTAIFIAAVVSGSILGVRPGRMALTFAATVRRLIPAIGAIAAMLALGFVTKYSGMDAVLGLAFTRVGRDLYPIFGTLLGWLGVALTGSDTSSNVLFGNLQVVTAKALALSPILMASANSAGGVMGKMIDAQSIVVAAAATGEHGHEGKLLRVVFRHSLALALLVGLIVWIEARI